MKNVGKSRKAQKTRKVTKRKKMSTKKKAKRSGGLTAQAKRVRKLVLKVCADFIKKELTRESDCRKYMPAVPVGAAAAVANHLNGGPNPKFSVWENAKCGTCGHDGSNDPNGENYLYKLTCPDCGREGCDECMPAGRGCPCPECEDSERDESNANISGGCAWLKQR